MQEGEELLWQSQPRIFEALPWVVVGLAIVIGSIAGTRFAPAFVAAGSPVGIALAVWGVLANRRTWYVVTTRGLYVKTGVLGRTVRSVEYERVQNSAYSQSITGTIFGHGSVEVEVAGGPDISFGGIYDPDDIQATIRERSGAARTDSTDRADDIPGSRAEWIEVRDELRAIRRALEANR